MPEAESMFRWKPDEQNMRLVDKVGNEVLLRIQR